MTTTSWILLAAAALVVVALGVSWVRSGRTKRQLAAGRTDGTGLLDQHQAAASRSARAGAQEEAGKHWRPMPPTGGGR